MGRCPLFVFEGVFTQLIERIRAVAERVARSYNLDIFDVQFRRESDGWVLRIFVDVPFGDADAARLEQARQRGVPEAEWRAIADASPTIEDCERVSRDVSAILDVEETIDHRYTLEVSSPGLDRPLRGPADFRRFTGRLAKIVVSEPIDRQSHFEGRLAGMDGDAVVIETAGSARRDGRGGAKRQRIPLSLVTRARLEVEF